MVFMLLLQNNTNVVKYPQISDGQLISLFVILVPSEVSSLLRLYSTSICTLVTWSQHDNTRSHGVRTNITNCHWLNFMSRKLFYWLVVIHCKRNLIWTFNYWCSVIQGGPKESWFCWRLVCKNYWTLSLIHFFPFFHMLGDFHLGTFHSNNPQNVQYTGCCIKTLEFVII